MKKTCEYCKSDYDTGDKRQKYCGVVCSHKSRRRNFIKTKCLLCGASVERYPSQISNKVFCSRSCSVKYNKKYHNEILTCSICGERFTRMKSAIKGKENHYCSYGCADIGWGINHGGEKHHNFTSVELKCAQCGKGVLRKRCRAMQGGNFFCSQRCQGDWMSENLTGENNPRYNPKLTEEERLQERNLEGYAEWRLAVYKRDDFTCQICGDKKERLNAHHLDAYMWDVENRTNVENGVTLCKVCHSEYHKIHGRGKNTKEEFYNYIKSKEAL